MKRILLLIALAMLPAFAQTSHQITLTFPAGAGGGSVTSFTIERSTASTGPYSVVGSVPFAAGTASYTYVDSSNLVEGITYFYEIVATGPGGTSAPSSPVSATVPFSAPSAPGPVTIQVH